MIKKYKDFILPVLANVTSLLLIFVPLDVLYKPYKIPFLVFVIGCCVTLYILFKLENGRIRFLILPFIVTAILILTLAEQYFSFGLIGRHMFS
jgi:hypothetical protein